MNGKNKFYLLLALFQVVLAFTVFFSVDGIIHFVAAQTEVSSDPMTLSIYAISAALSTAASVIASAWAIRTTGTAAISALSEREGSFFQAFLVVALCEALAIYGLIVGILLWTKIP